MYKFFQHVLPAIIAVCSWSGCAHAQSQNRPLTSKEIVSLVYQLPRHPEKRDEILEEIRTRGIGFPLTSGLRSLVATLATYLGAPFATLFTTFKFQVILLDPMGLGMVLLPDSSVGC